MTKSRMVVFRTMWEAFYRWFAGSFRSHTVQRYQVLSPWMRLVIMLFVALQKKQQSKRVRMAARRRREKKCPEACTVMFSDSCRAYCSHKCSPQDEGHRVHLGRHICCACYDLLDTDPATLRRDTEIRRAAFRRMGHIAEEINAASARQIHLLAQMADKAWPEVEDYCNPSITLDTSCLLYTSPSPRD